MHAFQEIAPYQDAFQSHFENLRGSLRAILTAMDVRGTEEIDAVPKDARRTQASMSSSNEVNHVCVTTLKYSPCMTLHWKTTLI